MGLKSEFEETIINIKEVKERYESKQPLTKDEFLYVICGFNPYCDRPSTLLTYLERYEEYKLISIKQ